jgi:hypothetical protein
MYLSFNISFPYKKPVKNTIKYFEKAYRITKNKSLEVEFAKFGHSYMLFCLCLNPSWYRSHSGFFFEFALFNYSLVLDFCDNRHWNYDEGRWCTEDEV